MEVLVIGGGAREHAILLALARDPAVTSLLCAPGNAGTAELARTLSLDPADRVAVLAAAAGVDLVVIGPEAPLVDGLADALRAAGVVCFGPSAAAARIEGSKSFAKEVMTAAGVPTAAATTCSTAQELAQALAGRRPPYVVKADGLAAGKGVLVTDDLTAAQEFGQMQGTVVVEDFLDGPEVTLLALTDGTTVVPLLPAQDFKRVGNGDTGPNTGGMGAYAPLGWLPDGLVPEVRRTVLQPVVDELARRGAPFSGLLYCGLSLTSEGPQVVEFNCRFGDPETQVVLALLETPLAGLLHACATGTLTDAPLRWRDGAAVTVVVAAEGYPGTPTMGEPLAVGALPPGVQVLHAGTRSSAGAVLSAGGRVLSVTATGADLAAARTAAYDGVAAVRLRGAFWRSDIAERAVRGGIRVPTRQE